MTFKLTFALLVIALASGAQTNSIHQWTLKSGGVFTGEYFSSGLQMVVIKNHGTNCMLRISDLSTNDVHYLDECKMSQRQKLFDSEANRMAAAGMVETTANLIRDFPEKVSGIGSDRQCWMDVKFLKIDSSYIADPDIYLGFQAEDKSGDTFYYFRLKKEFWGGETEGANPLNFDYNTKTANPLVNVVTSFKQGDKIRVIGRVIPISHAASGVFDVEKIEVIETASEASKVGGQ